MTDTDLILKGCVANWNDGIQILSRKAAPGLFDKPNYAPNIRNLKAAQQFIDTIKKLTNDLEEVLDRYHELCPPPHPQSPTAD